MDSHEKNPNPGDISAPTSSIEDVPSSLLLHILTFLPLVDAVSTSLVSRRFRWLWLELPSIIISYREFPAYSSSSVTLDHFRCFVDQLLLLRQHSSSLTSFSLELPYQSHLRCAVDVWIQHAVRSKVRYLSLHFELPIYEFPFFFLRSGRVESLRFSSCDVNLDCSPLVLSSLKSIEFSDLYLTDKMVTKILEWCPNLEVLRLSEACGLCNFAIRSQNLKFLELSFLDGGENCLSLELNCPELLELKIRDLELENCVIENLASLITLEIRYYPNEAKCFGFWSQITKMLDRCPQIRYLESPCWWFKLQSMNAFSGSFVLLSLRTLVVHTNYSSSDLHGLSAILELSPNLEFLTLRHTWDSDPDDKKVGKFCDDRINYSIPCLKEVKLECFCGVEGECNFLSSVKSQGVVLETITLDYLDESKSSTTFKKKSQS